MSSILDETIEMAKEDLYESEQIIANDPGPLTEPKKSSVAEDLDTAEDKLREALVILNDAGSADTSSAPSSLPNAASRCASLASEAHVESLKQNYDRPYIGSRVKTILWLFDCPNGYRARAGIS